MSEVTSEVRAPRSIDMNEPLFIAIADGSLTLRYQPIIDLCTGAVDRVEALARWLHYDNRPWVSPAEWIPQLETSGLIHAFGYWVAQRAIYEMGAKQIAGVGPGIAINVSPIQLYRENFADRVLEELATRDVAPSCLEIELTERHRGLEADAFRGPLEQLRRHGVSIALDDFGVGDSSLKAIAELPVDTLKIDQSLIHGLPDDERCMSIVKFVLPLAKRLGFRVVAEGIERTEQLQVLRDLGCDFGQGFLFAPALSADQITTFIRQQQFARRCA